VKLADLVKDLRGVWIVVAQFVCWAVVTVGQFMPEPPLLSVTAAPDVTLRRFAQFIGCILVGILLVFCLRRSGRRDVKPWLRASIVIALFTAAGYFTVSSLTRRWSCDYAGRTVIKGSAAHLTPDAAKYAKTLPPPASCEALLADSGGDSTAVWSAEELQNRYNILSALLVLIWLGSFASIVTVAQSLRCAQRPRTQSH
jgi:hypothetical protein